MPRFRAHLATLLAVVIVAGCTNDPAAPTADGRAAPTPDGRAAQDRPQTALPGEPTVVVEGTGSAELALATSRALYTHAPAVVLVGQDDEASMARATSMAIDLGVPLLLTPGQAAPDQAAPGQAAPGQPVEVGAATGALTAEVDRLDPRTLVTVGDVAASWTRTGSAAPATPTPAASGVAGGRETVAISPESVDNAVLPDVRPAPALDTLLVLAVAGAAHAAAAATAQASGARLLMLVGPDPRTDDAAIKALSATPHERVLAIGSAFGSADRLRRRVDTAATGLVLPGGGQVLFPGRRMVALYGHPGDTGLGVLGEQGVDAAVARAQQVAGAYSSLVDGPVIPAFEIITTIASSGPGEDGDYSSESSLEHLRPWVDAAKAAGIYVVLDLQPGRTDFLTQAQRYAELLVQPHVGLALDPEWRLKPDQRHLEQIGSVTADEINGTGRWLADLTREHNLPQKVLMLHQFRLDMIADRHTVVTDYDELRVVIHADGFGSAGQKFNTWDALHLDAPAGVWWGWKNFYDEDKPTFTPQETVAIMPGPVFVSYQ